MTGDRVSQREGQRDSQRDRETVRGTETVTVMDRETVRVMDREMGIHGQRDRKRGQREDEGHWTHIVTLYYQM